MPTQDDKIKAWITKAKASGATDEEIKARLKPEDVIKYYPAKQTAPRSFGKDLWDKLLSNVESAPDQARAVWQMMQRRPDPTSPSGYTGGLSSVGDEILKSLGRGLSEQQQRAGQEIQGGHPLYGGMRSILGGIVPGLGPQTMDIIDQSFGRGPYQGQASPGAATGDAMTMGAQMLLPELFKGAMAPVREAGGNMIHDALKIPPGQVSPSADEMTALTRATGATMSKASQQELEDIISTAQGNVSDDIMRRMLRSHPQLKTEDLLQPMIEKYAQYVRSGDQGDAAAQQLLKKIEDFRDTHGATLNLAQANDQKSLTWNMLNDKDFQKDLNENPGLKTALRLRGIGLKQGVEDEFGPGSAVAENNKITQVSLAVKKQLDALSNTQKSALARWLPRGAGMGAGAATAVLGGGYHNPWAVGGAIGTAGMANYITRLYMQDPSTMLNLGQFMNTIGEGNAAKVFTNLPKIGLANIPTGTQNTGTQAQPQQSVSPKVSPKQLDIPSEIQRRASASGYDPRIALEVARQESNFRQTDENGHTLMGRDAQGNLSNAKGIFQLMPSTAKQLNVNPDDPNDNIDGGVEYLGQMLDQANGDIPTALAAYHDGPTAIFDKKAPVSPEGQAYVKAIMSRLGSQ